MIFTRGNTMTIRPHSLLACILAAVLVGLTGGCRSDTATTKSESGGKTGTFEMNPGVGGAKPKPGGADPKAKHGLEGAGRVD